MEADLPVLPAAGAGTLTVTINASSLDAGPTGANLRIAKAAPALSFDVGGGCGTRPTLSTNGLRPALLDNATLLLLPLSRTWIVF